MADEAGTTAPAGGEVPSGTEKANKDPGTGHSEYGQDARGQAAVERLLTPLRMTTQSKLDLIVVGQDYMLRLWERGYDVHEIVLSRAEMAELASEVLTDLLKGEMAK